MHQFLKRYEDQEIEVRRKVSLFFAVLLGTAGIDALLFLTIALTGGALSLIWATGGLLAALGGLLLLLYWGRFNLSSGLFALTLLLAAGGGVLFDRAAGLFEIYIFVAAALFLLITLNLISVSPLGAWLVFLGGLGLVFFHFFTVALPQERSATGHLIRNLVLSSLLLSLGLLGSLASQTLHRHLRLMVLRDREEAEKMLRITEVYTKKSLINIIRGGEDPTTYLPVGQKFCILFNDIRNFTALSEKMGPRETVSFLNSYFDQMNQVIQNQGGEIDKLIGDCIMASVARPQASLHAAMGIHRTLIEYNRRRHKEKQPLVYSGTGIAYGEVVQGNIGSLEKMDYTIIGEVVNAASRLEGLTKYYRVNCLISEDIHDNLPGKHKEALRFLDIIYMKGSSKPMRIYEVFSHEPADVIRGKQERQPALEEARALYNQGNFEGARKKFEALIKEAGPHNYQPQTCADPALHYFAARAEILSQQKEAGLLDMKSWNGVYQFTGK